MKENSELYKITKNKEINTNPNTKEDIVIEVDKKFKKSKKLKINPKSIKYIIFISTLWLIFLGFLIAGLLVHFKEANNINAASILWALSFVVFIIACIYTYLYIKARQSATKEDKIKLLKYMPL
jgi:hypothetical protein